MSIATSILCPVDFSPDAERALRHAVALAGSAGARLTLLTVNDPILVTALKVTGRQDALRRQIQEALQDTLARVPTPAPPVVPAIDVATGSPATEILEAVTRVEADLVVIGTRGLGRAGQLLFGSTTERVLHAASVPVLVVPDYAPERMSIELGVTRYTVHRVIAAAGLDPADAVVAASAAAWARECAAGLTLAHVCAAPPTPSWWPFPAAAAEDDRLESAMEQLATLGRTVEHPTPVGLEVRRGHVASELAALAREADAGMVVLSRGAGTHRLGATAYRVAVSAHVPTLVVSAPPPPAA
ncbi:MAG: universal stress protein [Vicinamibacterales bacterium]